MAVSRLGAVLVAGSAGPLSIYIAQPIAPLIGADLALSATMAGAIIAAPTVGLALASPLVGAGSDRLGRKRVIVAALALMIMPTLLASTASAFAPLILCQVLIGLLIPGVSSVTLAYVGEEFPPDDAPKVIALVISANIAGGFVGRFVAALAADHWGWPGAFRTIAVLQALACLAIIGLLPPSRNFTPKVSLSAAVASITEHLSNPRLWAVFGVGACTLFLIVGVFTYAGFRLMAPPYGYAVGTIGYLYLLYLLSMATNPLVGRLIAGSSPRMVHQVSALGCGTGLLVALLASPIAIVTGLILFIVCAFASQSAASTQLMREAKIAKGTASGLYSSFYYLGGGLGAVLPSLAWTQYGWTGATIMFLGVAFMAGFISALFWRL